MNKLINIWVIVFSFILYCHNLNAQDKNTVYLDYQRQKVSAGFSNHFDNYLKTAKSDYSFVQGAKSSSVIILTPTIRKSGIKMIEGIETKKTTKASIGISVRNEAIKKDSSFTFTYNITASTDEALDEELFHKIASDADFSDKLTSLLEYFFSNTSCEEMLKTVSGLEKEDKIKEALTLLLKVENSFFNCKGAFDNKKNVLKQKYEQKICEDILYEANILINSGVEFQMNKAVGLLLKIPPTAQCRAEAIKLSEQLSKNKQVMQSNREKLAEYRNILIQNDLDWLIYLMNN